VDKYDKIAVGILIMIIIIIGFVSAQEISSETISSGVITSLDEDFNLWEIYDEIQKIHEISPSSLDKGYSAILNEKDAFKLDRADRSYYIIAWEITDENVKVIFPGKRQLIFGLNDIILVDVNHDGILDIELELKSIKEDYKTAETVVSVELGAETIIKDVEQIPKRKAEIYIKRFIEKELVPEGDYFELFDVTVRLAEEEIYTSKNLEALITFENFGEGISEIDIVYSIINENNVEVYLGVDSKVVQTEDNIVKDFNFLELPFGKYILRTEIFYGQNQTGESEQDFEIISFSFFSLLIEPLFFILVILILGFMVMFARKIYKNKKVVRKNENEA